MVRTDSILRSSLRLGVVWNTVILPNLKELYPLIKNM